MGFVTYSDSFWNKTQQIRTLHASVLSVPCPPEFGSASTEGDIRASFSESMASSYLLLSQANVFEWNVFQLLVQQKCDLLKVGYELSKNIA